MEVSLANSIPWLARKRLGNRSLSDDMIVQELNRKPEVICSLDRLEKAFVNEEREVYSTAKERRYWREKLMNSIDYRGRLELTKTLNIGRWMCEPPPTLPRAECVRTIEM